MLSLMVVETNHPALGRDLTGPECVQSKGRAMMQFGNNFADMGKAWSGSKLSSIKLTQYSEVLVLI